jgi:hypothetical protein
MRSLIAGMILACLAVPAFGQDDPRSTSYDKHLMITDDGLLDTQKRTLVLDIKALEASLRGAREYFDVRKMSRSQKTCDQVLTVLSPHYELRKAGRVYACLELASRPDGETRPGDVDRIFFVGPICDRAGACRGMLLTEIPKFSPLRDCGTAEGSVVCNPKYAEKSQIYYDIQSCNKEFANANVDELEVFKRKRGKFRLCAIDLYRFPNG